jgi:hypothetical protein
VTKLFQIFTRNKSNLLLLAGACLLGGWFRFWWLGQIPRGYTWDEIAISYDAWGLSLSGQDHHGENWPLTFKSLGDYKAPGFVYLNALVDLVLKPNEVIVRYISAFAGVGIILAVYWLSRLIFPEKPLVWGSASLLMAMSPLGIVMSRIGLEANLATLLVLMAIILAIEARKNPWLIYVSGSLFLAAFYTYQSMRLVVPLVWICLTKLRYKLATLILVALTIPYFAGFTMEAGVRARQVLVFYQNDYFQVDFFMMQTLLSNFIKHFGWDFLTMGKQINLRQGVPGFGILYVLDIPLLLWGLMKNKRFLIWIIISILPSAICIDSPHSFRATSLMPALVMLTAYGWVTLWKKTFRWVWMVYILTYLVSVITFAQVYFGRYATIAAKDFQYGYQDVVKFARTYEQKADLVFFSDKYGQPYIYTLWYAKIKPKEFLAGGLANYRFGPVDWSKRQSHCLYIGTSGEIPATDPLVVKTISYPNSPELAWVVAYVP